MNIEDMVKARYKLNRMSYYDRLLGKTLPNNSLKQILRDHMRDAMIQGSSMIEFTTDGKVRKSEDEL